MAQTSNSSGNNTGKAILVIGIVLLLSAVAYKLVAKGSSDGGSITEPTPDPVTPPTPTPATGSGTGYSNSSPNKTYAAPPFKSNKEGDTFRLYVNRVHPEWAKEHDLDPTGSYDNTYVRMAWYYFGNEYKYAVKPIIDKAKKTYSTVIPAANNTQQTVVNMAMVREKYPEYAWYLNAA